MSWGNKLLITFIVFGAMISYLVYRSVTTNFDLVEKEYYKSELRYQDVIEGTNRANNLSAAIQLEQSGKGIHLQLPQEMTGSESSGTVWFYCAYNEKKDKKFLLKTDEKGVQLFDQSMIPRGNYIVKIDWNNRGHNYYTEKQLSVL